MPLHVKNVWRSSGNPCCAGDRLAWFPSQAELDTNDLAGKFTGRIYFKMERDGKRILGVSTQQTVVNPTNKLTGDGYSPSTRTGTQGKGNIQQGGNSVNLVPF